ncbi:MULTISPECIES: hypothetical protein [Nocardia]|uniref:hypothetical protein n=1 Tax=Nocardia TaxID=1817 RepID=UPI000D68EEE6|nr:MULTISPECIES: hypothetical protein [Nocardia]
MAKMSNENWDLFTGFLCDDERTWPIAADMDCETAQLFVNIAFDADLENAAAEWVDSHRQQCSDSCIVAVVKPYGGESADSAAVLAINDTSSDGIFQIMDTRPIDGNLLFVTVRERIGDGCLDMTDEDMVAAMRTLAHRAYDGLVHDSPEHNRFVSYGCVNVTFAVTGQATAPETAGPEGVQSRVRNRH